jgi:adenosylcobinamide-phosphate synthase
MVLTLASALVPATILLDAIIGDPVYRFHPIRLMGQAIVWIEQKIFAWGWNTRMGGVILVLAMMALFVLPVWFVHEKLWALSPWAGFAWDLFWTTHCLALRDLVKHVYRIARAVRARDIPRARQACSMLVGRDTEPMDGPACCRAGIESLSENLTDGVISPLFWLVLLGVPGMVAFKVASTLDSMVGYKSERYLFFGWAGARLDDVMNYLPARITWILTVLAALVLPGYSARKTIRIGLRQHARVPGPNSGWSETAFAGALGVRIAGPIWKNGVLVNEIWLGSPSDHANATPRDISRAVTLSVVCVLFFAILALPFWMG